MLIHLRDGGLKAVTDSYSSQLLSLAFPVVYAIPIFNLFGNLAHNWMWWCVALAFYSPPS